MDLSERDLSERDLFEAREPPPPTESWCRRMRTVLLLEGPVMASFGVIVLLTTAHHRLPVALACFALAVIALLMALGTRHRIRAARAYYARSAADGWEPSPHDGLAAAGATSGTPRGTESWQ